MAAFAEDQIRKINSISRQINHKNMYIFISLDSDSITFLRQKDLFAKGVQSRYMSNEDRNFTMTDQIVTTRDKGIAVFKC